ncbi:MAG: cholesterol esterase [Alyxoria varia]|nr:MAG: cholesterol esterase [Alyxoria varia]
MESTGLAGVPFLGRLFLREYVALVGSLILIGLEVVVRVITLALPERIIRFFYDRSRLLFNILSSPQSRSSRERKKPVIDPIAKASDFVDLCELSGYYAEEHVVHTQDGYLLGIHRLAWRRGEEEMLVNGGPGTLQKPCIYLHHGLMMNSEVWVCLSERERCLPFALVEKGYDVWLGNNRGNKYSKKSVRYSPASDAFWNFSIDQFALHDIPDTISYILSTTKQPSLSYIGFSQGTAQAFAMLSVHPTLNHKVDVFIALAPAMSPPGLANGIVASFVKTSPQLLYLAFGRRSILTSATMWQHILYPPIFVRFIDLSLRFLFGWKTENITQNQKLAAYPHLYSFTSTKTVVHWFQIIRNGTFQMFDDEVPGPFSVSDTRRYYKVPKFPTRNIKTPIALVYGGSDSLVDIKVMLKELPSHTVAQEIPKYEHLDFLWASDVHKLVFPHVFDALDFYAMEASGDFRLTTKKEEFEGKKVDRKTILPAQPLPPSYSEDEMGHALESQKVKQEPGPAGDDASSTAYITHSRFPERRMLVSDLENADRPEVCTSDSPDPSSPNPLQINLPSLHNRSDSRASSVSSRTSFGGGAKSPFGNNIGASGISLGAGKAAGGVVNREPSAVAHVDGSERDINKSKKRSKKK